MTSSIVVQLFRCLIQHHHLLSSTTPKVPVMVDTTPISSGSNSRPTPSTFTRVALPLPEKRDKWGPLHLTFRPGKLPKLPIIHSSDILAVLSCPRYDIPSGPSKHSIKTLAWMGDAVLQLQATKATLLLAGFEEKTNRHLSVGSTSYQAPVYNEVLLTHLGDSKWFDM